VLAPRRMDPPAAPRPVIAAPAPVTAPAVIRPFPRSGNRACCWPLGEPGTKEFRFCGGESILGKPYCAEHAAIAYVRVRDRREDAA
jgi:GcrA cell cycle regulator